MSVWQIANSASGYHSMGGTSCTYKVLVAMITVFAENCNGGNIIIITF